MSFCPKTDTQTLVQTGGVAACVPAGCRVYAIGDIHGRHDLLAELHAFILDDAGKADQGGDLRKIIIYLGDYIDRGPLVKETITALVDHPLSGFEPVYLKGNHEYLLMKFLDNPTVGRNWLNNGGAATLHSYGVKIDSRRADDRDLRHAQAAFREVFPLSHQDFLNRLKLYHSEGDYYFTHAGVSPHRALETQLEADLLWVRDEFLSCRDPFGKVIVHGHSIASQPQIYPNRIGIDTGAYATGRLTCLILQENTYSFFQT